MIKIFFIALILTALAPMELYAWNPLEAKRPGTRTAAAPAAENAATDGLAVFDSFIEAAAAGEIEKMWQLFTPEMRLWLITGQGSEKKALEWVKADFEKNKVKEFTETFHDPAKKQFVRNSIAKLFWPVKRNNNWYIIANMPQAAEFFPQVDLSSKDALLREIIIAFRDQDALRLWLLAHPESRSEQSKKFQNEAQALIEFEKIFSGFMAEFMNNPTVTELSSQYKISQKEVVFIIFNVLFHSVNGNIDQAINSLPLKLKQAVIKTHGSGQKAMEYLKNNIDQIKQQMLQEFGNTMVQSDSKWYIKL